MMFKLFSECSRDNPLSGVADYAAKSGRYLVVIAAGGLAMLLLTSCRNLPPLPPADLHQPGWKTRQGQAVWKPRRGADGVAGDILVAARERDRILVQFSKNPFPLVNATITTNSWELSVPVQRKYYAHPGKPPSRVIWFQLAGILTTQTFSYPWLWTAPDTGGQWRLENLTTGESLEGFFSP